MTDKEGNEKLGEVATNFIRGLKTSKLSELQEYLTLLQALKEITGQRVTGNLLGKPFEQADEQVRETAGQLIDGLLDAVTKTDQPRVKQYLTMLNQLRDITGEASVTGILREVIRPKVPDWSSQVKSD